MADAQASSGTWSAFLKSIASFNGDLSSLTAPPFILSSQSLTEFSSYWATHPPLLTAAAAEPDAARRAMLVLKWFLSTLKHQYASRSEQYGNEKKPLNPFLGELFLGTWTDEAGTTTLVSEQVSHHPPATAYCVRNDKTGVQLEGYNAQKATFKSTIIVKQIGHAVLTVPVGSGDDKKLERYLITLPSLHIEGLIFGAPFVELDGSSLITSSSGYTAKVDYSGKGWLSGKKNTVRNLRTKESAEGQPWERRYFNAVAEDETLALLGKAAGIPLDGERDKTGGLWRFDAEKAAKADAEKLTEEQIARIEKEMLGQ
ncbi:Oxysterol-binding protein [Trichoderma longibrachiatum ATCC 18648]|uniref:Oxysterol-binding protein n=1 Tax=Trichoderma longibrachiatum ATCC 18648 TaxID=983965 RepID=A0A2T4BWK1_TRILO|nr:Oxysterol-binding protein [Trichoderma longibrachiatum ATCC 18648]